MVEIVVAIPMEIINKTLLLLCKRGCFRKEFSLRKQPFYDVVRIAAFQHTLLINR